MRSTFVSKCIPMVIPHVFSKISGSLCNFTFFIDFIAIGNVRRARSRGNTDNKRAIIMIDP